MTRAQHRHQTDGAKCEYFPNTHTVVMITNAWTVPFNDLGRIYERYRPEYERAAIEAMRSGRWLFGDRLAAFVRAFANSISVEHCLPVGNGTDALELALRAVASFAPKHRSEVVTVANAGGYSTTATRLIGLTPVYADIETGSQLLSINSALACLSEHTLAVVATHLYGGVVDVRRLRFAMDQTGYSDVPIIEDCAQAHGAKIDGSPAGSMGTISTFSFYPTKNLGAMGDAGAVLTSSPDYFEVLSSLHQYGWSEKYHVLRAGGRNSRMDELQAALLSVTLPHLSMINDERTRILSRYTESAPPTIAFLERKPGAVVHLAVLTTTNRHRLKDHLAQHCIATDIHYPILDCDQVGWKHLPQREDPHGLPISRRSVGRILSLPCFVGMTNREVDSVSNALATFSPQ